MAKAGRTKLQTKIRTEFIRQLAANQSALGRLEGMGSEDNGRCFATEQVRRAVKRGEKLLAETQRPKEKGTE